MFGDSLPISSRFPDFLEWFGGFGYLVLAHFQIQWKNSFYLWNVQEKPNIGSEFQRKCIAKRVGEWIMPSEHYISGARGKEFGLM